MPINSKRKGKSFELSLVKKLKEYGYEARRTAQYCGNTGDAADVIGLPHIHVEAKHQEQMRLYDWMNQAINDSKGTELLPAVFHKQNNKPILVTMQFDDWMSMYNSAFGGG